MERPNSADVADLLGPLPVSGRRGAFDPAKLRGKSSPARLESDASSSHPPCGPRSAQLISRLASPRLASPASWFVVCVADRHSPSVHPKGVGGGIALR